MTAHEPSAQPDAVVWPAYRIKLAVLVPLRGVYAGRRSQSGGYERIFNIAFNGSAAPSGEYHI